MKRILSTLLFISTLFLQAQTIAVSYFDNTSGLEKYNALSKGLADMLITDLSNIESIQIVEREKLQKLIDEIDLGKTEFFNPETAQKLGEGLGAEIILTGAFLSIEPEMRIDARLIEIETGEIIAASQVTGKSTDFFIMVNKLSNLITEKIEVETSSDKKDIFINIESVVDYSKSIDLFDKGLNEKAQELLSETVNKNPDFIYAKDYLEKLKQRIKKVEENRKVLVNAKISNMINNLNPNSDKFYSNINNIWTNLIMSPHKMLAFNSEIKKLDLNYETKIYGDASPITFGEMFSYYNIYSYNQLKNHIEVINMVETFLVEYPTSIYYNSVKIHFDTSVKELEERKKGKKNIKYEIKKYKDEMRLQNIQKYFQSYYKFKCCPEYITTLEDYNQAKNYYIKNVLDLDSEYLKQLIFYNSWDGKENVNYRQYGLPMFLYTSLYFADIDFAELLLEKHEEILLDSGLDNISLDLEDIYYNLEDDLEDKEVFESAYNIKLIREQINKKNINYYIENAELLNSSTIDSISKSNLDSLYIAIMIKRINLINTNRDKQSEWDDIFSNSNYPYPGLEKLHFFSLWNDAISKYENDTLLINTDKKSHKKYLRKIKRAYKEKIEEYKEFKTIYSDNNMLQYIATLNSNNKQYADEIAIRYEILEKLNLSNEEEAGQYYHIMMAYINLGYFEKAKEIFEILQKSYQDTSYGSTASHYKSMIYID